MGNSYSIKSESSKEAGIFVKGKKLADLRRVNDGVFSLKVGNRLWELNQRVDGEIRPFSLSVSSGPTAVPELVVKDHLFAYNGRMYMFGAIPEGRSPHLHMRGSKFICRLNGFPFADPNQVDLETKNRLRKLRGVPVAEFSGIGRKTHSVIIENDLMPIGLEIAAACFILYSSV